MIGWNHMIKYLRMVRILNLDGAMGTGKTLVSVALGYEFVKRGFVKTAAFNFPVCFGAAPHPRHSYSVIDEGGRYFDNRMAYKDKRRNEESAELTFNLRKLGSYLVVPSFLGVDKRLRVGMRFHRYAAVGRWLWAYQWEVGEEEREERNDTNYWEGRVFFFNPGYFFGTYDTYYQPTLKLTRQFMLDLLAIPPQSVPEIDLPGI